MVVPGMPGANDHRIDGEIKVRPVRQNFMHFAAKQDRRTGNPALEHGGKGAKHSVNPGQAQAADKVNGEVSWPGLPVKRKAPTEPEDQGRKQRPFIPIPKCPVKGLAPTHGMVKRSCRVINLRCKEQAEACCDQENLRSRGPGPRLRRHPGLVALVYSRTGHAKSLDYAETGVKSPLSPVLSRSQRP